MALELASGARELCTISGNTFTLLGETDGAISFLAAITKTAATVNGSTVYCYCFDNADPSVYEVMEMTYATSGDTLTRVATEHGSNGASAVSFGTGSHTIYRCLTEHDVLPSGVRILQKGVDIVTTSLVTTGSATAYAQATANTTKTPLSATSKLLVRWSASGLVARDGTSGAFAQARLNAINVNSIGGRAIAGTEKTGGLFNFAADTDLSHEFTAGGMFLLTNSNYNASGNWVYGLDYKVTGAVMDFTITSFECDFEEFE